MDAGMIFDQIGFVNGLTFHLILFILLSFYVCAVDDDWMILFVFYRSWLKCVCCKIRRNKNIKFNVHIHTEHNHSILCSWQYSSVKRFFSIFPNTISLEDKKPYAHNVYITMLNVISYMLVREREKQKGYKEIVTRTHKHKWHYDNGW